MNRKNFIIEQFKEYPYEINEKQDFIIISFTGKNKGILLFDICDNYKYLNEIHFYPKNSGSYISLYIGDKYSDNTKKTVLDTIKSIQSGFLMTKYSINFLGKSYQYKTTFDAQDKNISNYIYIKNFLINIMSLILPHTKETKIVFF